MQKFFKVILVVCVALFITACSSKNEDPGTAYKGETATQIFQKGEAYLRDRNYSEAAKRYEALNAQYPFSKDAEMAQLHVIYAYYEQDDYILASAAATRYIHLYPASQHADYAYLMRGMASYNENIGMFSRMFNVSFSKRDLTSVKKSFHDFSELVQRFPRSKYAPVAHQYMVYLRDIIATHELDVAKYYMNRHAYVAAVNRANAIVQHYQGAPAVKDALIILVNAYRQLHMDKLANGAYRVLAYNFKKSEFEKKLKPA